MINIIFRFTLRAVVKDLALRAKHYRIYDRSANFFDDRRLRSKRGGGGANPLPPHSAHSCSAPYATRRMAFTLLGRLRP
ncbi:hypothetical protein EVAR_97_1 [Eumeta japonica]|uniref:Uncharacterized protein n=1 Tax=Eumeta variegata TaxID=151549 RepID=A0A4C1S889_EUMVA|nr:hypothetical protein EVAR_97_1 [Eumeta japonica]